MKNISAVLSRVFLFCTYAGSALTLFIYFLLPFQSIRVRLHFPEKIYERQYGFLLLVLLISTALAALLRRFFQLLEDRSGDLSALPPTQNVTESSALPYLRIILSLGILARTIYEMDWPFDNDELGTVEYILNKDYTSLLKLLHNSTHPIASWSTFLSMKLFGVSIWTSRAPAILFTVGFLYLLYGFCKKHLNARVTVFVYLHLLVSAPMIWYFHSLRGNVSMLLLTFYLFTIVYKAIKEPRSWRKCDWYGLGVALFLLPFTHGFGTFFGVFLPFALISYAVLNQENLKGAHFQLLAKVSLFLLCYAPFLAACLAYTVFGSVDEKYLSVTGASQYANSTFNAAMGIILGGTHTIQLKLVLLTTLLGLFFLFRQKQKEQTFILIILFYLLSFVAAQHLLLNTFITGRYFVGLLPLFIIAIGLMVENIPLKPYRLSCLFMLYLSLIVIPFIDGSPSNFQIPRDNFYSFIKTIRKATSETPRNCISYSYSGEYPAPSEAMLAEKFYFPKSNSIESDCKKRYHAHFGWPWQDYSPYTEAQKRIATEKDLPKDKKYGEIITDHEGRFLAEILQ